MIKFCATSIVALLAMGGVALAESQSWNVTEEGLSGIKNAQGVWAVKSEGGKISGVAELQLQNGSPLGYKIEGTSEAGVVTINLVDRTDGKKDCVWTGKEGAGFKGLAGDVLCGGKKTLLLRASH